ncbi:MAG: TonB-dependent receptor [Nonlabens sp.]
MKCRIILLFTTLFISSLGWSQSVKIQGVVIDSAGNPLQMANVIAYQKDRNLGAFGITNDAGKYQLLDLKRDSTYVIKVSFLGLRTVEDTIKNIQTNLVKNYVLLEGADELDAVNLVYEMPVTIKGDTISYNADSFTNGTERKLGEVIQKIPGMEVNEDGDVQVEGKTVEKIMVNGKDFFEGDTRLATKNIPANAVKKVEVLRNYNNVSQLKGLGNDQDRIAINIKLKEGKENFWFGDATVGVGYGGLDERYLVQPKAFYYSEKFSMNILTDVNNLGVPAFTGRDYRRFTGFRRGNTVEAGGSISVANSSNFNPIEVNRATNVENKFAALNTIWTASPKLDLKAFAIFADTDTDAQSINQNLFIGSGLEELRSSFTNESTQAGIFKLGADFKPNENLSFDYDGQINITNESSFSNTFSESSRGNENIDQLQDQNPYTIDQSLNAYYTLGEKNVFSFESRYVNQEEDPFRNAVRDLLDIDDPAPFDNIGLLNADPYNLSQEQLARTNKLDAKLDYWYILNKKSNINFLTGTTISSQNYSSNIFQILDDGQVNELDDPSVVNDDVQFDYRDVYVGARYKVIFDKWTFTPGAILHSFQTQDLQNGSENTLGIERLLPEMNIRYDIRSSASVNLDYRQNVIFNDINAYAEGLVLNGFNSLQGGNNQLTGAIRDQISLNYNDFNMFNYQFVNANITYSKTRDAVQSSVDLESINQQSRFINTPFENESISGRAAYSREIKKIQTRFAGFWNYGTFGNIVNGQEQESVSFNQTYAVSARSNFQKGVNFNLGYTLSLADNMLGDSENNTTNNRFSIDADWQIGKRWFLRAEYDYNIFTDSFDNENDFDFLDATLRYKKPESKWEYSLIASNILDRDARVQNSFGQIVTSTNSTFVLPRYIYFQVQFDL